MDDFREEFSKNDPKYNIASRILARWYARLIPEEELSNEDALKQINGELRDRCKAAAGEVAEFWTSTYPTNVKVPTEEVDRWIKFVESQVHH